MASSTSHVLLACRFSNIGQLIAFSNIPTSSEECFGIHLGDPQSANLGDGNGWVNQTVELREDYGSSGIGTCLESLIGGNHLRSVHIDILVCGDFIQLTLQVVSPKRLFCGQWRSILGHIQRGRRLTRAYHRS